MLRDPHHPPIERLTRALLRELTFYLNEPRFGLKKKSISSVYFGGGTPSLATPSAIAQIIDALGVPKDTEVTLEANPTSSEEARLEAFRDAGINRLSLGIQSFDDKDLKLLGRDHSAESAIRVVEKAKRMFDKVTFDMIFARPGQTREGWNYELKHALELAGDHLSIYQLSMERGTPLWKSYQNGKLPALPTADDAADMYEDTVQTAQSFGFQHYEVSSYAKTAQAISKHNFAYWQGIDYVGIGPGSHGRLTDMERQQRVRTFGEFHPDKYMTLCEAEGEGIRKWVPIPYEDALEELVVFGLRTRMGIPASRFEALTGRSLDSVIDQDMLRLYVDEGLLKVTAPSGSEEYVPSHLAHEWKSGEGIRPTEKGLAIMDSILPNLLKIER
ncbi:coproporphyrinogen III oxidase [Dichotomocladium elegans]|nr:coproporphyrinogen III oxidase [Dichotomocladium elegans]